MAKFLQGKFANAVAAVAFMLCLSGNESAQATTGGSPYVVPVIVDTTGTIGSTTVEVDLEAVEATVDIGNGVMANAVTFNGGIPGPEFRLKKDDTVIVHFRNKLKQQETGIHWHGIEVNNAADGSPVSQEQVKPGHKFDYKFTVTRPGIFWYHPHHHSSTNQVFKGLYGSVIVTDPHQLAGVLPSAAQTKTLVLSDITVCKAPGSNDLATFAASLPHVSGALSGTNNGLSPYDLCEGSPLDNDGNFTGDVLQAGDVPNIVKLGPGPVGEGQTVLTNGVNVGARAGSPTNPGNLAAGAQTLAVQPGQGLRLQVINAAATRYVRLHLTDNAGQTINLVRVGGQGGLLDQARLEGAVGGVAPNGFKVNYNPGEILIPPGGRADVVAEIPQGAQANDILTLWTEDFRRTGGGYAWLPSVPAAHLMVAGNQVNPAYTIPVGTALRSESVEILDAGTGGFLNHPDGIDPILHPDITFTNTGGGPGINDIRAPHDHSIRPESARFAERGDTLEIKVVNRTGAHHPFHLHGFSFQPKSLTDTLPEDPGNGPNASPGIGPAYMFPYNEFVDEVDIPGGYTLTFLVRLDDRSNFYDDKTKLLKGTATPDGGSLGRWLFHCHILFHANLGMISELDVVAPTP